MSRPLIRLAVALPVAAALAFGGVYAVLGRTPAMALLLHGRALFLPVAPTSPRLSASVRRVLAGEVGTPHAGTDAQGWVVIGTTADAYVSLARLAAFLASAPLELRATLNLEGGPVSCQAVRSGTFARDRCGDMEVQSGPDGTKKLSWLFGRWALPVALAVVERRP